MEVQIFISLITPEIAGFFFITTIVVLVLNMNHFFKEGKHFSSITSTMDCYPLLGAFQFTQQDVTTFCVGLYCGISLAFGIWKWSGDKYWLPAKSLEEAEAAKTTKIINERLTLREDKGLVATKRIPENAALNTLSNASVEPIAKVVGKTATLQELLSIGLSIGTILGPFFIFSGRWLVKSYHPVGFMTIVDEIRNLWSDWHGGSNQIAPVKRVVILGAFISLMLCFYWYWINPLQRKIGLPSLAEQRPKRGGRAEAEKRRKERGRNERGRGDQPNSSSNTTNINPLDPNDKKDKIGKGNSSIGEDDLVNDFKYKNNSVSNRLDMLI